ncbi:sugar phosphate isomerase [Actinomyces ruminis]|uniref:Sugar phosphate isomerase n=1 Tax=Actinomyces ruminis TaxID=1937003 RepID=A0ABX4M8A4_9ACTO|nr:sugar phosphate isomerase [Actinomyces ruminis]
MTRTPQGLQPPQFNREYVDNYIKQLAALGFSGLDTMFYSVYQYAGLYGSMKAFEHRIQDLGLEKVTGVFRAWAQATRYAAPHVRQTHERIIEDCRQTMGQLEGLTGVENFIVMPSSTYYQVEPVTDDKIKTMAELWSRVGEIAEQHGMRLTCHLEFWGAIRTPEQIDTFFGYSDPRYVNFFCDTAQHAIAGVDPVELFRKYSARCSGFHFKDAHQVDRDDLYRTPPDPERQSPGVRRWFHEMGAGGGLVDFPGLMRAIVDTGWDGLLTVEHDEADMNDYGSSYAQATAVAKWYIDNVLAQAERAAREATK